MAGDTPDNNYTGNDVPMPDPNSPDAKGEVPIPKVNPFGENDEETHVYYRHRMIQRFSIPKGTGENGIENEWTSKDGLFKIPVEEEVPFLEAVSKLHRSDSSNISKVLNIVNERSAADELKRRTGAIRGAATTENIVGRVADSAEAKVNRAPPGAGPNLAGTTPVRAPNPIKFGTSQTN